MFIDVVDSTPKSTPFFPGRVATRHGEARLLGGALMSMLIFLLRPWADQVLYDRAHNTKERPLRVTAATKQATKRRILAAARKLFRSKGFDQTTTRDIASAARIASGTLFNYFSSKEAIASSFVAASLAMAYEDFQERRRRTNSLEEDLFLLIVTGLRRLEPYRRLVPRVLEGALSSVATPGADQVHEIRADHLETVKKLFLSHGQAEPTFVTMHLYWSLYAGVLAFWATDASKNQEDTLAVLDRSLKMLINKETAHTSPETL